MKRQVIKVVAFMMCFAVVGFVANNCGKEGTAGANDGSSQEESAVPDEVSSELLAKIAPHAQEVTAADLAGTWVGMLYGESDKYNNAAWTFNTDGSYVRTEPSGESYNCDGGDSCTYSIHGRALVVSMGNKNYFFHISYLANGRLVLQNFHMLYDLVKQ